MILSHPEEQPRRWAENIKAESVRMKHLTEELLSPDEVRGRPTETGAPTGVFLSGDRQHPAVRRFGVRKRESFIPRCGGGNPCGGDAPALSQLLEILLDNAVKYSPEGGTTPPAETAGRNAKLSVSNTGQPIPEQDLPHIFERLAGDPSRHPLEAMASAAIARSIVEVHKGKFGQNAEMGSLFYRFTPL